MRMKKRVTHSDGTVTYEDTKVSTIKGDAYNVYVRTADPGDLVQISFYDENEQDEVHPIEVDQAPMIYEDDE